MIFLIDIDGTIADLSHRLHLISSELHPADWTAFYMACGDDKPIWEVITVARALHEAGHKLIMPTGRSEICRDITMAWLKKYRVPNDVVMMRQPEDHREDNVVKSEMLDGILVSNMFRSAVVPPEIGGAFEDRQQVVDMYRARGVRVFQVAPGKF